MRLALAGTAITAALTAVHLGGRRSATRTCCNAFRFWTVGSLAGRDSSTVASVAPFLVVGHRARAARSPGRSTRWRSATTPPGRSAPTSAGRASPAPSRSRCCAARATAAAGPIVFVGLTVPHVARAIIGPDQRWVLPYSALLGAGAAARRRRPRPRRRAPRRAPGRHRHRDPRRARLHRARAPAEDRAAVTALVLRTRERRVLGPRPHAARARRRGPGAGRRRRCAVVAIGTGDYPVSPGEVIDTLLGGGSRATSFIIETLRLPRVLCAVLVGVALGIVGRDVPEPDPQPARQPRHRRLHHRLGRRRAGRHHGPRRRPACRSPRGALAGGLVTAVLVYGLAFKRGVSGYRLVLVGIGISALAMAAIDYLLTRARHRGGGRRDGVARRQPERPRTGTRSGRSPARSSCSCPLRCCSRGRCACSRWATTRPGRSGCASSAARVAIVLVARRARGGRDDRRRADRVRRARRAAARAAARAAPQPRASRPRRSWARRSCWPATSPRSACCRRSCRSGVMTGADRRRVPGLAARRANASEDADDRHARHRRSTRAASRSRTTSTSSSRSSTCAITDGEFTAIVGPNACGKSTLLRALARMLHPKEGTVLLDGELDPLAAVQAGRATARPAAAELDRARRDHRRRPRRPRPLPAPAAAAAVVARRRARRRGGAGGDRHDRPRRPVRRRAVRRPAPARVARDGARPGDGDPAARRADDLPRHRPPGRGARPLREPRTRAGPHARRWSCTTSTRPAATRRT